MEFLKYVTYSVVKDMYYTTALNDAITQKYFLSCFIVFLLYYSLKILQQSLRAALHFFSHKHGSCPLCKQQDIYFLWSWQSHLYEGTFQLHNTRKVGQESKTQSLLQVTTPGFSTQKRNPPLSQSLRVQELIEGLFCLYFVHTGCIYYLRLCSLSQCVWTNKHRKIGTDTLFGK